MSAIIHVTQETLESEVYGASNVVLLDLWAPWCAPCRALAPMLERLAALGGETLTIAKMDVEQFPDAMNQFAVRGIPALLLFKDGKEISREVGTKTLAQLKDWMTKSGVQLTEPAPRPTDVARFGAFYGDTQLKQFFCDRLLAHAQRDELQWGGDPFWFEGSGTLSAALVHSADPEIFERLTGLLASFSSAFDFVGATQPAGLEPIVSAIKPGSDLNHVPLLLIQAFLSENKFDWPGLLSQSSSLSDLCSEWTGMCDLHLKGKSLSEQPFKNLVDRTEALKQHSDGAVSTAAELIESLSPPPASNNTDAWLQIFNLATDLVFSVGQHLSGWTLEDRQTEGRRHRWFTEKESQTATGEFSDEELDNCQKQWFVENETYQLKEEAFFKNGEGIEPVLSCLQQHMTRLLACAPTFVPA